MGHIFVNAIVRGSKSEKALEKVLVDSGASFTVLPREIISEVGFYGEYPKPLELNLGDGKKVSAKIYLLEMTLEERTWPIKVASFEGAIPVIGVDTLEGHGLALDLDQKKLVPTRGNYALYV